MLIKKNHIRYSVIFPGYVKSFITTFKIKRSSGLKKKKNFTKPEIQPKELPEPIGKLLWLDSINIRKDKI